MGCVCRETHGSDMFNSCVGHSEGQVARHVEKKPQSTRTRFGVWRSLEGLMPVGDELATDPRRVSEKVHVEKRDGRSCATQYGTRLVELGKGCEVEVKIPCVPEKALMVGCFCHLDQEFLQGKHGDGNLYVIPLRVGFGFFLVLFRV